MTSKDIGELKFNDGTTMSDNDGDHDYTGMPANNTYIPALTSMSSASTIRSMSPSLRKNPKNQVNPINSLNSSPGKDDPETIRFLCWKQVERKNFIVRFAALIVLIIVLTFFIYEIEKYYDKSRNRKEYLLSETVDTMPLPFVYLRFTTYELFFDGTYNNTNNDDDGLTIDTCKLYVYYDSIEYHFVVWGESQYYYYNDSELMSDILGDTNDESKVLYRYNDNWHEYLLIPQSKIFQPTYNLTKQSS